MRETDLKALLTTSADVNFFEEFIELGGIDLLDAICVSIGNSSYWMMRKTNLISKKYRKPVWVNALFGYPRSFYRAHTGPGTPGRLPRAQGTYRKMLRNFFLQRAVYVSPYIFRLVKFGTARPMNRYADDFLNMARKISYDETPPQEPIVVEERFGYRENSLTLEQLFRNTAQKLLSVKLDEKRTAELNPGETATVHKPIVWNPARPLENYITPRRNRLWLHNTMGRTKPIKLDGNLSEWEERSSSWILMT